MLDEGLHFDDSQTVTENLQRAVSRADVDGVRTFLNNLIHIEAKNSKIMAISPENISGMD